MLFCILSLLLRSNSLNICDTSGYIVHLLRLGDQLLVLSELKDYSLTLSDYSVVALLQHVVSGHPFLMTEHVDECM